MSYYMKAWFAAMTLPVWTAAAFGAEALRLSETTARSFGETFVMQARLPDDADGPDSDTPV